MGSGDVGLCHGPLSMISQVSVRSSEWKKCVHILPNGRQRLKCDGTRAGTRFRLSAKRASPFNSAGASLQSTTVSRVVRISDNNSGYTMFRGSVKSTGYPLHSHVFPSLPLHASSCTITFQMDSTQTGLTIMLFPIRRHKTPLLQGQALVKAHNKIKVHILLPSI